MIEPLCDQCDGTKVRCELSTQPGDDLGRSSVLMIVRGGDESTVGERGLSASFTNG